MKAKIHANIQLFVWGSNADDLQFPLGCFHDGKIFTTGSIRLYNGEEFNFVEIILFENDGYRMIKIVLRQSAHTLTHLPLAEISIH